MWEEGRKEKRKKDVGKSVADKKISASATLLVDEKEVVDKVN